MTGPIPNSDPSTRNVGHERADSTKSENRKHHCRAEQILYLAWLGELLETIPLLTALPTARKARLVLEAIHEFYRAIGRWSAGDPLGDGDQVVAIWKGVRLACRKRSLPGR